MRVDLYSRAVIGKFAEITPSLQLNADSGKPKKSLNLAFKRLVYRGKFLASYPTKFFRNTHAQTTFQLKLTSLVSLLLKIEISE